MVGTRAVSDEGLARLPKDGRKYELVDGEIQVSPAGYRHGLVIIRLIGRLWGFVAERKLGDVLDSSTGFRLPSGNVRSPDLSFVATGRVLGDPPKGFAEFAPDLAVEVLSPGDDPRQVMDKVGEYLRAGVRLVWVIDPEERRAAAYRSPSNVQDLREDGVLDGEDVIPGFRCALKDLLQ